MSIFDKFLSCYFELADTFLEDYEIDQNLWVWDIPNKYFLCLCMINISVGETKHMKRFHRISKVSNTNTQAHMQAHGYGYRIQNEEVDEEDEKELWISVCWTMKIGKEWSSTHRLCAYTEGHDKTNGIDATYIHSTGTSHLDAHTAATATESRHERIETRSCVCMCFALHMYYNWKYTHCMHVCWVYCLLYTKERVRRMHVWVMRAIASAIALHRKRNQMQTKLNVKVIHTARTSAHFRVCVHHTELTTVSIRVYRKKGKKLRV